MIGKQTAGALGLAAILLVMGASGCGTSRDDAAAERSTPTYGSPQNPNLARMRMAQWLGTRPFAQRCATARFSAVGCETRRLDGRGRESRQG